MVRLLLLVTLTGLFLAGMGGPAMAQEMGPETAELFQYHRGQDVFFMLMLVAFLMLFIKRYEWGVCLATLLVLAVSWPLYLIVHTGLMGGTLDIEAVILAVFASITLVIAIGVFLGHVPTPAYLIAAVLFVPAYMLNEWFIFEFLDGVMDAGGSILVHLFAAFWGWGVILSVRNSQVLDAPMNTTVHSVSFVWLAAMLLLVLWPSFVTALLPPDQVIPGMINAFMALLASSLTAYLTFLALRRKVDPLVYTYALLAGGVAIGATVDLVGPVTAWIIGALAGVLSVLSFLYVHDWLRRTTGVLDTMGVNNLHGIPGIFGGLSAIVVAGAGISQAIAVVGAMIIALATGLVTGLVLRTFGRPTPVLDDAESFPMEDARRLQQA
jgi:ammonium transporter Rh